MRNIELGTQSDSNFSTSEKRVNIGLEVNEKLLPTDSVSSTIDEYEQYLSEKDASKIYRPIFTINPLCTNVLFNAITEITDNEGSAQIQVFESEAITISSITSETVKKYLNYKGSGSGSAINRESLINDTGFSHPEAGGLVYHCGYDIFNNHTLRNKEFYVINKLNSANNLRGGFNSLSDYERDGNGDTIKIPKSIITKKEDSYSTYENVEQHLYQSDTVYSFKESINQNLIERDGWFGFINPSTIETINYVSGTTSVSLNKCMNNNKACEMIDMYPDRELFSFLPKKNKKRARLEYNWKFCLTYPSDCFYQNELIQHQISIGEKNSYAKKYNGIKCDLVSVPSNEDEEFMFRSHFKNNLTSGDLIEMTIFNGETLIDVTNRVEISNVGYNGEYYDYYFTVPYDNLIDYEGFLGKSLTDIRIRKIVNGEPSHYYFRVFRRLPNFKNSDVYKENDCIYGDYDSLVDLYSSVDFECNVNKLAFERTIFNDNSIQLVYTDDIDLSGLRDNLNRPLSEFYLTIVKNNSGYDKWYGAYKRDGVWTETLDFKDNSVEYSHCFGKLTSGLDLPEFIDNYNVHKIHNINISDAETFSSYNPITDILKIKESPKALEYYGTEITIKGYDDEYQFLGDIVEFRPKAFDEIVCEDVYFRFNTGQREYINYKATNKVYGRFANLHYSEIQADDFEIHESGSTFQAVSDVYNQTTLNGETRYYPVNVFPEGYYYKAHYRVKVRELNTAVNEGAHTKMKFTVIGAVFNSNSLTTKVTIKTDKNYYVEAGNTIYAYKKGNAETNIALITNKVFGKNFEYIVITFPYSFLNVKQGSDETDEQFLTRATEEVYKLNLFKHNSEKPYYAYELNDGTGRYIWRDLKSESELRTDSELYNSVFTNGAHYPHKTINFFLKRQDPKGDYGLQYGNGVPSKVLNLIVDGERTDISGYDYTEEEDMTC
jgi:hypothetical protein